MGAVQSFDAKPQRALTALAQVSIAIAGTAAGLALELERWFRIGIAYYRRRHQVMIVQCPNCPATMDLGLNNADLADRSYKLLCPALRENLAAKVLRANLAAQQQTEMEPDCPHMRNARNGFACGSAILA